MTGDIFYHYQFYPQLYMCRLPIIVITLSLWVIVIVVCNFLNYCPSYGLTIYSLPPSIPPPHASLFLL